MPQSGLNERVRSQLTACEDLNGHKEVLENSRRRFPIGVEEDQLWRLKSQKIGQIHRLFPENGLEYPI
jgi:hypothetical protein